MEKYPSYDIERVEAPPDRGLSAVQAAERMSRGLHNAPVKSPTRSVGQILRGNLFTLFNAINVALAILILSVGEVRNVLFLGVAVCSTIISTFQELRAKRTVDRLAVITQSRVTAVRDGEELQLPVHEIVPDDILRLSAGAQICADGVLVQSEGLEADESLLTGESVPIPKKAGDSLLSGSFVAAGGGRMRVMAIGADSYAARLGHEARRKKVHRSELMRSLDRMLGVLTIAIIPIGAALFCSKYLIGGNDFAASLLSTSAAMLGMIPEGLMLLVSVALAVGALNLARRRTLAQSPACIETLARVDVLCLDKTGTITSGALAVTELIPLGGADKEEMSAAARRLLGAMPPDNATDRALREYFEVKSGSEEKVEIVPFSSARKWSAAMFGDGRSVILGAPEKIPLESGSFDDALPDGLVDGLLSQGLRVLALCAGELREGAPAGTRPLGLIVLADEIRPEAPATFDFFARQGVTLKVISGDNAVSVSAVAVRAGLGGAESYADMSKYPEEGDFSELCENTTVFGRVSPRQKQALVASMQKSGHVVAMTGDGVNDVLALRDADCSVAMASGSDAARSVADFVLLDSNFDSMVSVVREGRRVVNNIERVASLYLVKTIYSSLLSVLFVFLPFLYPFNPIQLTPVSALCVGAPSFLLALRLDYNRLSGKFLTNVLQNALPAALVTVVNILCVTFIGGHLGFDYEKTSTMSVLMIAWTGLLLLVRITSRPRHWSVQAMLAAATTGVFLLFGFFGDFFTISALRGSELIVCGALAAAAVPLLWGVGKALPKIRRNR